MSLKSLCQSFTTSSSFPPSSQLPSPRPSRHSIHSLRHAQEAMISKVLDAIVYLAYILVQTLSFTTARPFFRRPLMRPDSPKWMEYSTLRDVWHMAASDDDVSGQRTGESTRAWLKRCESSNGFYDGYEYSEALEWWDDTLGQQYLLNEIPLANTLCLV